jgi:hypothetical protein
VENIVIKDVIHLRDSRRMVVYNYKDYQGQHEGVSIHNPYTGQWTYGGHQHSVKDTDALQRAIRALYPNGHERN